VACRPSRCARPSGGAGSCRGTTPAPALLGYGRGGNRPCDIARIRCDCLVRIEPGSDALLLGKAFFVVAGARVADSFFLIERHRPLAGDPALADW